MGGKNYEAGRETISFSKSKLEEWTGMERLGQRPVYSPGLIYPV